MTAPTATISAAGVAWGELPAATQLREVAAAGLGAWGPTAGQLEAAPEEELRRALREAGVQLAYAVLPAAFTLDRPQAWARETARAAALVDRVAALGGERLVLTTGPAGALSFEEAAAAFAGAVAPLREHAAGSGVALAVEICNQLRDDLGFLYTLRDAVEVARECGIGVCADLLWCWRERDLRRTLREAVGAIELVQVSDCAVGSTSMPCRLVPGDGAVPLRRILAWLLEAGYQGPVDLELLGPRIEAEGAGPAVRRGAERLRATLALLGR